jgi:precorrin-2 dehydrogenase/sirohydrochlorin ferrochelatase
VSPSLTDPLAEAVRAGRITHRCRVYEDGDLDGFVLAVVATGDVAINAAVAAEGRRRCVWVNAADDPSHCDFFLPSVLRRGALTVAVSTGGASPALARAVREEIERHLGEDYAVLADVAGDVRRALRAERRPAGAAAWREALADPRLRRLVARGDHVAARRRLRARLTA